MSKHKPPLSERDCRMSREVLRFAKSNGVKVRYTKGSHFVMQAGDDVMTGYHGEISNGVAKKIFEFFVRAGLISSAFGLVFWLFYLFE